MIERGPGNGESKLTTHARRIRIGIAILAFLFVPTLVASAGDVGPEVTSEQIAERLAGSIRFETVSYEDAADFRGEPFDAHEQYLRETYPRVFSTLEFEKVSGYTLLFQWPGSDPSLEPGLFMSHIDVVPVSDAAAEAWTKPPYGGVIEDGLVWGRGALDVKTGVILWLEAVEALLAEGVEPKRTIYLSFGHDEEVGGKQGAKKVAELLRSRGVTLAFLFDEGGFIFDGYPLVPDRTVASIVTAEKAYYTIVLRARGVSGHSSMPPEHTAIGKLARAITRVEDNPMPARFALPVKEMLESAAPYQDSFLSRFALGNLWLMGGMVKSSFGEEDLTRAMLRTTFAVTLVSGGVKENVIPELAEATVNVRILPGDTPEQVIEHLTKVIDDPEIEVDGEEWGQSAPAASKDGAAFKMAAAAVLSEIPDAVVLPGLVPGATDTRHFPGVAKEILRFVPMQLSIDKVDGAHGRDERIGVEHLARSRRIAIEMVRRGAAGE